MSEHETSTEPARWERLEGETGSSFRAFCIYRALPPGERSIDAAYARYSGKETDWSGQASGHFKGWASKHDWRARAELYDEHLIEQAIAVDFEEQVEQLRLFRTRALLWSGRADAVALDLLERIEGAMEEFKVKDAQDASRLARAARELMDSAQAARAQASSLEELLEALDG